MCGIVGIYLKTKKYEKQLGKFLSGMLDGMATRGPDSAGFAKPALSGPLVAIPSNIPDKNLPSCFSYFFVFK